MSEIPVVSHESQLGHLRLKAGQDLPGCVRRPIVDGDDLAVNARNVEPVADIGNSSFDVQLFVVARQRNGQLDGGP